MSCTLHTDELTRRLYANDASMYEELPAAVAFPQSEADMVSLLADARERKWPITARAAGTSLAGQATGSGIVMDVSRHMDAVIALDPATRLARVQPGVIRDTLNRAAVVHGLHFAPDTATTNRCAIGGMIGNNSAGLYSVRYGSTRDHIHRICAVLADGSPADFGPLTPPELSSKLVGSGTEQRMYREMLDLLTTHAELIHRQYPHPDIVRRNTGYALDRLLEMEPFTPGGRPFNLAELLCGSEGTLALTVEAEVRLTPLPRYRALVIPHFHSLSHAVEAAITAVRADAAAAELLDDMVLSAALRNEEQKRNRFFIEGEPSAILIVELHGDDQAQLMERANDLADQLTRQNSAYAAPVLADASDMTRVWNLRKAGLGLLMGVWSDKKTPEFMEDTAVRVQDLPAFVRDVQALIARHETRCVYYGHASVGELHLRPELNLGARAGVESMKRMAEEMADLVRSYRGSLSGEHGDGRVRAPYIERVLGPEMMPVLERVKRIWDPDGMLNPGKILPLEPLDAHLRITLSQSDATPQTVFHWRDQSGFTHAVERCNGAGVCRKRAASGGTMCPSYMATGDEKDSTRGRANLFRQLIRSGDQDAFASDDLRVALDLCLGCKACRSECPASVDMARMKAEFLHGWHQRKGVTRSERFWSRPEKMLALATRVPGLTNRVSRWGLVKRLLHAWYGIHPSRTLPPLARETFGDWFQKRMNGRSSSPTVMILNDPFMNYVEPAIGQSMVHVLEAIGEDVGVTEPLPSVRARLSMGFLDEAKALAAHHVRNWRSQSERGVTLIGQDPSELLALRDEYLDLLDDADLEAARLVASRARLFEEYVAEHSDVIGNLFARGDTRTVYVHGHCHAKAATGMDALHRALRLAGYDTMDLKAGCCGMAGSFGYESAHYELSMQVGELVLFPGVRKLPSDALICAHGFSCRHQIADGTGRRAWHPAELMAERL